LKKKIKMLLQTTASLIPSLSLYTFLKNELPTGPTSAVIAGSMCGLTLGLFSHSLHIPSFPESMKEYKAIVNHRPTWHLLKTSLGFATLFTVYEGLVTGIDKSRRKTISHQPFDKLQDPSWHFTHFLAGGVSGLAYRAATLPLYKGVHDNPLLTNYGPKLMASTFLQTGFVLASLSACQVALQYYNTDNE
jgi:hypothetical protein